MLRNLIVLLSCCCGIGALAGPSPSTPDATKFSPSIPSTSTVTTSDEATNIRSEVDRIFAEQNLEYESRYTAREVANAAIARAESELAIVTSQIVIHQSSKPIPPTYKEREWSTIDEKFNTLATLIVTDNDKVKLKKADGKEVVVPKDILIAGDRIYVDLAFNKSSFYKKAMLKWNDKTTELAAKLSTIQKRIESGKGASPMDLIAPSYAVIEAGVAAAKAEHDKRERIAKAKAAEKSKADAQKLLHDTFRSRHPFLFFGGIFLALAFIAVLFSEWLTDEDTPAARDSGPAKRRRKKWSPAVRNSIWQQCGRRCFMCNEALATCRGVHMHLDHLKPLSKGGLDDESNLVAMCPSCNLSKGATEYPELYDR